MITEVLVQLGLWVAALVGGAFPTWTPPEWFVNFGSTFNGFYAQFAGLGNWTNWTVIGAVLAAVVGTWVVCAAIKLLRAVASYIPFFGGAG